MHMPFWKSLSDLFDEKVKKKDFTIPRTEKDVWGSEVVIVDGENIQKYKLETWAISVPFKPTDSANDIVCRALKQLIPAEELHLPDKSAFVKGRKYIEGYKIHQLCEWRLLEDDGNYYVGRVFDKAEIKKGYTNYLIFVKYAKILEDKDG